MRSPWLALLLLGLTGCAGRAPEPYALDYRQMEAISDQTGALLEYSNENREWVRLTFPSV